MSNLSICHYGQQFLYRLSWTIQQENRWSVSVSTISAMLPGTAYLPESNSSFPPLALIHLAFFSMIASYDFKGNCQEVKLNNLWYCNLLLFLWWWFRLLSASSLEWFLRCFCFSRTIITMLWSLSDMVTIVNLRAFHERHRKSMHLPKSPWFYFHAVNPCLISENVWELFTREASPRGV